MSPSTVDAADLSDLDQSTVERLFGRGWTWSIMGSSGEFLIMTQWSASFRLSSLDGTNGFKINGTEARPIIEGGVAGDVNDDGFDDLIFGGSGGFVLFGHTGGFAAKLSPYDLDGRNGFLFNNPRYGHSGNSVSDAGDINGDGIADFLIGGSGFPRAGAGTAYVVFGHGGRFDARMDLSKLDGSDGFSVFRDNYDDGVSVSTAGDVNGDGIDDFIVGFLAEKKEGSTNANFVVFGRISGFRSEIDLDNFNGRNGFGLFSNYNYNTAVSSAGDINNDGIDDLIVGNSEYNESYVLFGRAGRYPTDIDKRDLNGKNGFILDNGSKQSSFGFAVSSAGDLNGDGFDDLIIGDPDIGVSYVVLGRAARFATSFDVDRLNGANGFKLIDRDGESFGASVSSAGDVNGDGFDDVIIGATSARPQQTGVSYVVFGKSDGFDSEIDVASFDGNDGFRIVGANRNDYSSYSVSSAGDINHDGFGDLVVSGRSLGAGGNGVSYVIFGRKPDAAVDLTGTDTDQTLAGSDFADRLDGLGGRDMLYGHGGDDTLFGGMGADFLRGASGSDRLRGSFGPDTLFGGVGQDLLHGGAGRDSFLFGGTLSPANRDAIDDFSHAADTIQLVRGVFARLDAGRLRTDQFKDLADPGARLDANDRILYDHDTGVLSYDADGSGRAAARVFAVLENSPNDVNFTDFFVV